MSIKLLLPILFSLYLNGRANAQDSCVLKRFKLINTIVGKAISIQDVSYANKLSEFYIIDIKINDSTGRIENIDYFKKSNSCHYKEINKALQKIKEGWIPLHCGAKRLLIPIWFMFETDEAFDYQFDIQNNKGHGVFVNEIFIVGINSRKS